MEPTHFENGSKLISTSGEGGEKSLLWDPGSELRLGKSEKRRAKIINGTKKKKKWRR